MIALRKPPRHNGAMKIRLSESLRKSNRTQSWLAAELGVSRGYVSDLANGKKTPSIDLLQRIAATLDVPPGDLFDVGHHPPGFSENAVEAFQPPRINSMAALVRMIAPGTRNPDTYRARRTAGGFGILAGDLLIADIGATPENGDLVLIDRWKDDGTAVTLIRRVIDGYMLSENAGNPPETLDPDSVTDAVIGVIRGVLRGGGLASKV